MNKLYRESLALFFIQVLLFGILCINFRAIAMAHYHIAAISDFFVATLQFFVIKKIASSEESWLHWLGYTAGSVVGCYLGIYISTIL